MIKCVFECDTSILGDPRGSMQHQVAPTEEQDLGWRHGVRSKLPSTWQSDMHFLCIFLYIHSLFKINHHSPQTVPSGDHSGHTYPGTHSHQRQDHKEHGSIQMEQYQRSETPLKTLHAQALSLYVLLMVRSEAETWRMRKTNRKQEEE